MLARTRLPGKQREMLEHDAAVGARRADRLALDQDLAGLDRQEAADQIEQRRLAAAGRTEQREEFAAAARSSDTSSSASTGRPLGGR